MTLTNLITIRLSPEEHLLYKAEAARRGHSLCAYLRERLKKNEMSPHDLQSLRDLIKNILQSSSHEQCILLEALLLLRHLSSPKKMLLAHKELNRLNIPVWQGDGFSKE